MRGAGAADTVVPICDSLAGGDAEKQSATGIDVVIFEIDTLQPRVVLTQSLRFDKGFQQPFLGDPVNTADQRMAVVWDSFENESPVFE